MTQQEFLKYFPNHTYRYIDQTGESRPPLSQSSYDQTINDNGYEAYFTVNGFANFKKDKDNKLEHCTNLNCFFVDVDDRKSPEELETIKSKITPTFIVETMRGYHLYWLLDEPLYKEEMTQEEWASALALWSTIEQSLVTTLKGDPAVKDATRILRVPETYYWKKKGNAYKEGTDQALFQIKIIHEDVSKRYSMQQVKDVFPSEISAVPAGNATTEIVKKKIQADRDDFFNRVNSKYPIDERPSYLALVSGKEGTLPPNGTRNSALLVTACLARQANKDAQTLYDDIVKTGWHGMVKERGGQKEIKTTIESAYRGEYTYGRKNLYIEFNTTDEEVNKLTETYASVIKDRKELDRVRFSTYENELLIRFPYLRKNEAGILYNYENGVYKILTKEDTNKMILDSMYDDNLWTYRTSRNVADKLMCLITLLPFFVETDDEKTVNVLNGLLDITTRELRPHTPKFVTLVQIPVEFDPLAVCPTWDKVISTWTEGDEQEKKSIVLQQYAGYCLSSSTKHGKALFLIGDGGNGKSTYADTIGMLVGDKATSRISLENIYTQFGLAGLIGKRLNIVEEISANYFHGHTLKSLISGEEVSANIKYRDSFKFKPQAKFIFSVNQMPRVDDASSGMERRILAVNFHNNFRNNPNTDLRFSNGLLAKELPGILNWALDGVKSLTDNKGFIETEEKKQIIQDYREENSSVDGFIAECIEEKQGEVITSSDLYEVYREFCQRDGRTPKARIGFAKELKMYAHKTHKFSFIPRKNTRQDSQIEGIGLTDRWSRNFTSAYDRAF